MKKIISIVFAVCCCGFFFLQATSETNDYRGFVITKTRTFQDEQCTLVELEHTKTGLKIAHIQNDDPENLFSFCFRTLPTKSHGIAHVLEHSVLEGSKKFPIKNLSFKMMETTLATFINAMTAQECTYFPASSQYPDDFYNLMNVYADCCFNPLLTKQAFHQEGHRLEFETFDDPATPLVHKGVVYNEMKAVMASPYAHLYFANNHQLFPDAFGEVYAGGDPQKIPELTYEELLQFHKAHYYPGNCLLFLYGNIPLERHLDFLADNVLLDQPKRPPVQPRPRQPQFDAPRYRELSYPSAQEGLDKSLVSVGWMINAPEDVEDCVALQLIENILFASDAAPVKQRLMQSGFCKEIGTMVDADKPQIPFVIFFDGCKREDGHRIEDITLAALQQVVDKGIDVESIERIVGQVELTESELRPGKGPIGMKFLSRVALIQFEGKKPEYGIEMQKLLHNVQERCRQEPGYLEGLIKKHLLDNSHRVTIVLEPSAQLEHQLRLQEKERLQAIKSALSEKEIQELIEEARISRMPQETTTDLPRLKLESVSNDILEIPLEHSTHNGLQVHFSPQFTNHISYASLEFDLPELAQNELWKTGLYAYLLPQLGSRGRTYEETLNLIEKYSGGIKVVFGREKPVLKVQTKGLDKNQKKLFELMYDTLTTADFSDKVRMRSLIIKHAAELEVALKSQPMELAVTGTLSFHSMVKQLEHHVRGLEYFDRIFELAENLDARLDQLIVDLQNLQKRLLPQKSADLLLTCDRNAYVVDNFSHLSSLIGPAGSTCCCDIALPKPEGFSYPVGANVALNARGMRIVTFDHPDSPYVLLASELLTHKYLHPMIREERGAYGAKAFYEPHSGNFFMLSYRDPNIKSKNESFEYAVGHLAAGGISDEDVLKAQMAVIRAIDMPKHAFAKAESAYLNYCDGRDDDNRREFRRKLLTAKASDIQRAVSELIAPHFAKSVLVSLASQQLLESHCNQ